MVAVIRLAKDRRGAVLVEFALVALLFYLLMAATIEFGRLIFAAQVTQDAARLAARELSVTPLPAVDVNTGLAVTFDEALRDASVVLRVFDAEQLVIDVTADMTAGTFDLHATCAALPLVNRALCPLLIVDRTSVPGTVLLRYPGTLLADVNTGRYLVMIAMVTARDATGAETAVQWMPVLEEVRCDPADPATGPFGVIADPVATCPGGVPLPASRGLAAVRVNYPFQSASLSSFRPNASGNPVDPTIGNVNEADDSAIAPPPGTTFVAPGTADAGVYVGPAGLGQQFAFGRVVRPYRRVVSGQAIYRREVFR